MNFKINKISLNQAISTVQKAISTRTTDPLLEGIYVRVKDNTITLFATDNIISIVTKIECKSTEDGEFVVASKLFGDIIRKLPDALIDITVDKNMMNIKCEKSKFNISIHSASGFPEIPSISGSQSFTMDCQELKTAIRQTSFAVSQDEIRKTFTGVLMHIKKDHINFVALDGFRLALKRVDLQVDLEEKSIIPARSLTELSKILPEEGEVKIITSLNAISFESESTCLYSTLLAGEFFSYDELIRKDHDLVAKVIRRELINSLERASLLAKEERANLVRVEIKDQILNISSNSEIGDVKEDIFCQMEGREIQIAFNSKYLLDGLKIMEDEEVRLNFIDSVNPLIIKGVDDESYLYLVLPVRLAG
ncbi:DNA polymerase III subunit beta [Peptoniphilus sp. GNH]|nr:DNA polymerase III subunit beta [Peptoniphilus sp. GNH]